MNKMASKKRKLEEDRLKILPDQTEKRESREMLIYIIPKKIPKARLQVLNNLAQRKGFLRSPVSAIHARVQHPEPC